jgi:hypothetical protein
LILYYLKDFLASVRKVIVQNCSPIKNFFFLIKDILFYSKDEDHIRISFANFGRRPAQKAISFFLQPLEGIFKKNKMRCKLVHYKPDIHIFSVFGGKKDIIKSKAKYKIFYSGENTNENSISKLFSQYKGNCTDLADLSLGHDFSDQNILNYVRYPFWLFRIFWYSNSKESISKKINGYKNNKFNKSKFCALIAHHDKTNMRIPIYQLVSSIAPVDCPSRLLHNDDSLQKKYFDDKARYLQQYKFNICPENSISPGYVSEKPFEAWYSGCIPIYAGWSKDPEPGIINPNAILWFEPNGINDLLLKEIVKLNNNEKLFNAFMAQDFFLDTAVEKIYTVMQEYFTKASDLAESCVSYKKGG